MSEADPTNTRRSVSEADPTNTRRSVSGRASLSSWFGIDLSVGRRRGRWVLWVY